MKKIISVLGCILCFIALRARASGDGVTELMNASFSGNTEKVQSLLAAHADVNAKNNDGDTALIWASDQGHVDCVKALLDAHADVDTKGKFGATALMWASYKGHVNCVKALLDAHADVDAKENDGDTALIWASGDGHVDCVKALLDAGADIEAKNKFGNTALMWASNMGHVECVKVLLDAHADVNAKEEHGYTALMAAALSKKPQIVKILLEAGADVTNGADVTTKNNEHSVQAYRNAGNRVFGFIETDDLSRQYIKDAVKFYIADSAIYRAANQGNAEELKRCIAAGENVNAKNKYNNTVLMRASYNGHADCVKALLDAHADVNAKNREGVTALMMASVKDHADCVRALLDAHADVNAKDNNAGQTALMMASDKGHADCVRALLDAHADVDAKDNDGNTALAHAEKSKKSQIAEILRGEKVKKATQQLAADNFPKGKKAQIAFFESMIFLHKGDVMLKYLEHDDCEIIDDNNVLWKLTLLSCKKGDVHALTTLLPLVKGSKYMDHLYYAAARANQQEIFTTLLKQHPISFRDKFTMNYLMINALEGGSTAIMEELLKQGGNVNMKYSPEHVKVMARKFEDINEYNPAINTNFFTTEYDPEINPWKELIAEEKVDVCHNDRVLFPLLINAVKKEDLKMVQVLVEHGAAVSTRNNALHLAITQGNKEMCQYLIDNGANVNFLNSKGQNSVILAKECGQTEIAEMLIKAGGISSKVKLRTLAQEQQERANAKAAAERKSIAEINAEWRKFEHDFNKKQREEELYRMGF